MVYLDAAIERAKRYLKVLTEDGLDLDDVLSVERTQTKDPYDERWLTTTVTLVLTTGGPHVEIEFDYSKATLKAYVDGLKAEVPLPDDLTSTVTEIVQALVGDDQ